MIILRIKDIREDADVRQATLAAYLHIRQNTYSQYENEKRQMPIDVLIKLADYFHVSTDYILERTDRREPYPKN